MADPARIEVLGNGKQRKSYLYVQDCLDAIMTVIERAHEPVNVFNLGTAEFVRGGKTLTHAWMMAAQGDLAVAVYVDTGETGAGTAGPILEAFLRGAL